MNINNMTLNELTQLSIKDFVERGLPAEVRNGLLDVRLSGLSTLQYIEEELREATEEDIAWYKKDHKKQGLYSEKMVKRLVREAPMRGSNLDTAEVDEYLKDCNYQEREAMKEYLKEHAAYLRENFFLTISEWFTSWYAFWADQTDITKVSLDWNIYFSLVGDERPPEHYLVRFNDVMIKFNTVERNRLRPKYLEKCWNNEEVRNKVLRGEMFNHNTIICPYSTVFSFIHRRQERVNGTSSTTKKETNPALRLKRAQQERAFQDIINKRGDGQLVIEDGKLVIVGKED